MDAKSLAQLAALLQPGQLITNAVELLTYEVDAANDRGLPDGVVLIRSVEDVQKVVKWAAEHGVAVIARGAGTGLSGGAVAQRGGIILEFSQLNRLLEFDRAGRSVVVEPGMVNLKLDETVKKAGLYFPPDPASGRSATIGGNLAENAGGPHCFKYGVTTNYVTGLEVVLADGTRLQLGGRALDYPEYDFVGLFTGSEGTLGIITQASFRLLRNPPAVKTMMAAFDTIADAGNAVSAIIARGLTPATMEFMDQKMMGIIEAYAHAGLPVDAGAALIIEVDGYPQSLDPQMDEIVAILKGFTQRELRVAQSAEERERIWYGRKSAAGAMARLSPAYYLLDGTVPRSQLARTLEAINALCDDIGLRVGYVFHAGDGNLHPFILIDDPSDAALMQRVHEAGRKIMEICVGYDGSITGEHGVGIEKRAFMPLMYSPAELQVMREIKEIFDPQGILNPGKVLPEGQTGDGETATVESRQPAPVTLCPENVEEAVEMMRALAAAGETACIRGAGTKSGPQAAAARTLDTRRLTGIRKYALEDLYVTVGAGTSLQALQAELAQDNMWVPLVSPWPEATLGGIVAANFNAPLRMRYGGVRDLLLAATVVLPDGRRIRAGRPVVKNVAGYDLPKLFVGSWGTLGLIADVTLKLAPRPRTVSTIIVGLDSVGQGLGWGQQLLQNALIASALLLCHFPEASSPLAGDSLIYTAEGMPEDVAAEMVLVQSVLGKGTASLPSSGSEAWAEWVRAARAKGGPFLRVGVAAKDLPALLENAAPLLGKAAWIADLASGLLYVHAPHDTAGLRRLAEERGGYAVGWAEPWGYASPARPWMRKLQKRWDAQGLFKTPQA